MRCLLVYLMSCLLHTRLYFPHTSQASLLADWVRSQMDGLGNKWPVMFMVMSESNSEAGYAVAVIHNIYFRFHNLVFFFFGLF